MDEIENRMVVDSQWSAMEKEELVPGHFNRYGLFVKEEYLLEVAMEDVQNDSVTRDAFIERILDYIENDKIATERFLKWFYPDYKEK